MTDDPLDPELASRLRAELDRVQPRYTAPRYQAAPSRPLTWRFAPAALVASVISMLALSAYAATGSPNPADWGRDVVTIIQSSSTTPTPSLSPTVRPTPVRTPTPQESEKPAEHESPEPTPEPSDDHSGESSGHDGSGSSGESGGSGAESGERQGSTSDSDEAERS